MAEAQRLELCVLLQTPDMVELQDRKLGFLQFLTPDFCRRSWCRRRSGWSCACCWRRPT